MRSGVSHDRRVRAEDIALAADFTSVSARVAAGATLATILHAQQVATDEVEAIVRRAASVFDVRKVRTNQPYLLEKRPDGTVRRFEYEIDGDRVLRVSRPASQDDDLTATVLPIEKTRRPGIVRGRIDRETSSLVAAMDAAGETIDLTLALADVFSGDIDFNTDLQPGDRFELLVEKQYRERAGAGPRERQRMVAGPRERQRMVAGPRERQRMVAGPRERQPMVAGPREPQEEFAGYGPILAAEFENAGHRFRAVRFTPDGGSPGYFDERGISLRRFFLKSPLKFDPVVTSGFSRSRLHPVLHEVRAHLGVDYRAPTGAPVVAVAGGTVVAAGSSGGSGRMVHLRHANGYETQYLHLSSIAVRRGARVEQGEIIGRVGATGLATGPHLDYRLKKNGVFVNPVTAHRGMPPGEPVPSAQLASFAAARDRAFASFSQPAVIDAARVAKTDAIVK
ncbi:MAG TPA: M23 family metallopeptidase [Vicinamibacterales bacterium]|jgi:murein DD-endopeptidase MepM/ murein hydrolase activator NlpD|nr:M23 family metallopeptidase [Vicinamibacterales bacterium]